MMNQNHFPSKERIDADRFRHSRALHGAFALLATLLMPFESLSASVDDTALFSTSVSPNVMVVVDSSGSMNHVVWHPAYDPNVPSATSGCTYWEDDRTYYVAPWYSWNGEPNDRTLPPGTSTYNGTCGNSGRDIYLDQATIDSGDPTRWSGHYLNWYFSDATELDYDLNGDSKANDGSIIAQIQSTRNGKISACLGGGTYDLFRRSRMSASKQILADVFCQVNESGDVRFGIGRFRRNWYDCPCGDWSCCDSDVNGGFVTVPVNDYRDENGDPYVYVLDGVSASHAKHIENSLATIAGESDTPLSETLFQIYTYFMSRTDSEREFGADGGTFPRYRYSTSNASAGGAYSSGNPPVPDSPVEEWCQKNFVIMITDGMPTRDDFDEFQSSRREDRGFDDFEDLIGDYHLTGDEDETPATFGGCTGCESSLYLDDIARFMSEVDFQPNETKFPGPQTIELYTVGFTTGSAANGLLQRAAKAGNGKFFSSNDPEQLTQAIVESVSDIIEKSQGFSAGSIPASRSTDGNNFYTSYFIPSRRAYWEGHLKAFEFNKAGEVRDHNGACALDDPGAPSSCSEGALKLTLDGFWDAANEIPAADEAAPDGRNLFVSRYATPPMSVPSNPIDFAKATLGALDLGFVASDFATDVIDYANVGAGIAGIDDSEELADAVVGYARGCEFGDPVTCTDRGDGKKLHDIFHSNPLVVGAPNAGHAGPAYREYRKKYSQRKRVLYAGSNGGFLHGFNVGEYRTSPTAQVPDPPGYDRGTGKEEFGFMPWAARQNIRHLPIDEAPRDYYYVDGSAAAADVWLPPSATAKPYSSTEWNQWRTVLVGGLRQGGESYYALDVTNPPDFNDPSGVTGGPGYPMYMWEFPCEAASCDSDRAYMGETWSEPIITRVKATVNCSSKCETYDRWVAIVGGGYASEGDPNDSVSYDATNKKTTSRKGRAIFMIDVASGEVLAAKRFDPKSDTAEGDMRFAFPSAPAVFDVDFDGYADVVYIGDLGGNLWKWALTGPAEDHIRGSLGDEDQDQWPFFPFFNATACTGPDCSPNHYKPIYFPPTGTLYQGDLILAFGTGDRQRLKHIGTVPQDRDRYYVIKDVDISEKTSNVPTTGSRYDDHPMTMPADVVDWTSLKTPGGCTPPPNSAIGYYIEGEDGEKFITNSVIFFGLLFTGSYVPTAAADACDAGGAGYLYGIDLACGAGAIPDAVDPKVNPPDPRIPVGPGLPNTPRVSIGPLDEQDPDTGCDNVVMVMTSENEAVSQKPVCAPTSGVRVKSWKND